MTIPAEQFDPIKPTDSIAISKIDPISLFQQDAHFTKLSTSQATETNPQVRDLLQGFGITDGQTKIASEAAGDIDYAQVISGMASVVGGLANFVTSGDMAKVIQKMGWEGANGALQFGKTVSDFVLAPTANDNHTEIAINKIESLGTPSLQHAIEHYKHNHGIGQDFTQWLTQRGEALHFDPKHQKWDVVAAPNVMKHNNHPPDEKPDSTRVPPDIKTIPPGWQEDVKWKTGDNDSKEVPPNVPREDYPPKQK